MSGYERSAFLYDAFDSKDNVGFFLHYAAQTERVLDVGAGTGRIAIPLAEQGIHVTCIEPSPAMRAQFQKKLERRARLRHRIAIVPGEAASFDLQCVFPVAILSGVFDHFLGLEQQLASLENIIRHLEPGGTLIFDVLLGLMEPSLLSPAGRFQRDDREYRRFVGRQVLPDQRVKVELVFEVCCDARVVERIEEESVVAITNRDAIHDLLGRVNCSVRNEFSDYNFSPYQDGDNLLIVEAICHPQSPAAAIGT